MIDDLYSKRNKKLPDVYQYDHLPEKLKNQIYHIWDDFLSKKNFNAKYYEGEYEKQFWDFVLKAILKAEGKKSLFDREYTIRSSIEIYFDVLKDIKKTLDVVELIFFYLGIVEEMYLKKYRQKLYYSLAEAIKDLNYRFRENGVGYQFTNNRIVRVDSQILHEGAITPALDLLSDKKFSNVNDEFLKALSHYRYRRYVETLNECSKSFESTLKIICALNKWPYNQSDTANKLIDIVLKNNLIPIYYQNELSAIRQLLESSVPMIRNKNSAHGKGAINIDVPEHLASYMLYMTGATIKFLIESHNAQQA